MTEVLIFGHQNKSLTKYEACRHHIWLYNVGLVQSYLPMKEDL